MNKIQQAIQLAIEKGGYDIGISVNEMTRMDFDSALSDGKFYVHFFNHESEMFTFNLYRTFLDPLFWQALGESLGWDREKKIRMRYYGSIQAHDEWQQKWQFYMHRFIDHLIEGKNAESYFEALLTK